MKRSVRELEAEIKRLRGELAGADDMLLGATNNEQLYAERDEIERLARLVLQQRSEIERLRAEGAGRYWEARWRDADAEIERLEAALQRIADMNRSYDDAVILGPVAIARAALERK